MHIHSVIISYNRKELTKQTLQSYLDTVSIPHSLVIVDNGSSPDTIDWLKSLEIPIILLEKNKYPGYATNRGWELAPKETTYFHRIDNDTLFLSGWCENMIESFKDLKVAQYGLIAEGDEEYASWAVWPVGGNSIITRQLYDEGLRYIERPWTDGGILEDHQLTLDVWDRGYKRVFSTKPTIKYLIGDYPEYYKETDKAKGLK